MSATIINLAEAREQRARASGGPLEPEPAEKLKWVLLRDIARNLGVMPYEEWVAAGRPPGR